MEYGSVLLRTVLIYFVVFLIMRFMGKREIGKLSVFDLVISVMIAEIAVIVIEDVDRAMWEGILPMAVLLLIQVGIAFIALKNRKIRLWFDGKPSVIIAKGKLNRDVMRKQRYNLDDLLLQLRENKINTVADVEFAILETTGKLSVVEKEERENKVREEQREPKDLKEFKERKSDKQLIPPQTQAKAPFRFEMLPIPLIMDGKVQDENLAKLDKTRFWLKNVLQEQGVHDFKEVFLCTIDHRGRLFVDCDKKPRF